MFSPYPPWRKVREGLFILAKRGVSRRSAPKNRWPFLLRVLSDLGKSVGRTVERMDLGAFLWWLSNWDKMKVCFEGHKKRLMYVKMICERRPPFGQKCFGWWWIQLSRFWSCNCDSLRLSMKRRFTPRPGKANNSQWLHWYVLKELGLCAKPKMSCKGEYGNLECFFRFLKVKAEHFWGMKNWKVET